MKLDLNIGAQVYSKDGHCGKLVKVVVNPDTQQVTELIVENGLLVKHALAVPVAAVERVADNEIYLNLDSNEFNNVPVYRETEVREPIASVGHSPSPLSYELGVASAPKILMARKRLHEGIAAGKAVIGRKTEVGNLQGTIGHVDHIVIDTQSGKITQLVMRKGFFPEYVVIPQAEIEEISDDKVFVNLSSEELAALPRYHPRKDEEIQVDVQHRLQEGWPAFSGIAVTSESGSVRLTGYVKSKAVAYHAAEVTQLVDGVIDVQNDLIVDPAAVPVDRDAAMVDLARQVHHALITDPRTADAVIEVVKDHSTVILQGKVDSEETRRGAEAIALQQPGVTAVDNQLVVARVEAAPKLHYS